MNDPTNDSPDRILDEIELEENALRSMDQKLFLVPVSPLQPLPQPPDQLDVFVNQQVRASSTKEVRARLFHRAALIRGCNPDLPSAPSFTDNPSYDVFVAMRNWCVDASRARKGSNDPQCEPQIAPPRRTRPTVQPGKPILALAILFESPEISPTKLAERVGVSRGTLYKTTPKWKIVRETLMARDLNAVPKGSKATNGAIEAEAECRDFHPTCDADE